MAIENVDSQEFGDLFSTGTQIKSAPSFTASNDDVDILEKIEENVDDSKEVDENQDVDILETQAQDDKTYPFKDMSGYFEDRFKTGKFAPIVQDDAEGKPITFIPKTPEEFDEVIDLQVSYQLEEKTKDLEKSWYSSKSPAWQAVARFAEMSDDPTELLPFIQGVRTVESVNELDPTDLTQAEKIVKTRLQQRGDDEDVINEQIEALKTTDKLVSAAQKYKPLILNEEKKNLNQMMASKKQQELEYGQMVAGIRENALKAIEAPIYGKQKLKQEEKAAIYDMIAEPSQETNGYPIYTAIDKLFESGDFEKLKKIAMILTKEDALLSYISAGAANKTAAELQTKLRVSTEGRPSGGHDNGGEERRPIQRQQYGSSPRFGR